MSTTSTSRTISVEINGTTYERDVPASRLLVHFLRDTCGLTGTHVGCETSICGACTVQIGGKALKSCTLFAVQADSQLAPQVPVQVVELAQRELQWVPQSAGCAS